MKIHLKVVKEYVKQMVEIKKNSYLINRLKIAALRKENVVVKSIDSLLLPAPLRGAREVVT